MEEEILPSAFKGIFIEKVKEVLNLTKARIMMYPFKSDFWLDIRGAFKQTECDDDVLFDYYAPFFYQGKTYWEGIARVAEAVNKRLKYATDLNIYGKAEYWASPIQVHNTRLDDCDGSAVLLCRILRLLGLTEVEVFVANVQAMYIDGSPGERHAVCLVFDKDTWQLFPLEGSWYGELSVREFKEKLRPIGQNPRYKDIEWITNDKLSFSENWLKIL